jgi:hypothetical protein
VNGHSLGVWNTRLGYLRLYLKHRIRPGGTDANQAANTGTSIQEVSRTGPRFPGPNLPQSSCFSTWTLMELGSYSASH